jgi:small subunit ribosomal protein S17
MPKRILSGVVRSAKSHKTVVVEVERRFKHPRYHKIVKVSKNYSAHDENSVFKEGDLVRIIECRPISRTKKWMVITE